MSEFAKRRVGYALQRVTYALLILIAAWNIWIFGQKSLRGLPNRDANDLVIMEDRYRTIRAFLMETGYKGTISFVTNRDIQSQPATAEDNKQWGQAQYVMTPWLLVRQGIDYAGARISGNLIVDFSGHKMPGNPLLVIGDFWDGEPAHSPEGLTKIYDSGRGLNIYRRTQQQ